MKAKPIRYAVIMMLLFVVSCDEPVTVVTNYVHPDGSVTRKIEMRNTKNNFAVKDLQVPFDSTWIIKDSLEISSKGDTTWVKRAEKLFKDCEEINLTYLADSGANKKIPRHSAFNKSFKWFNTDYRFSEIIDKSLSGGYLLKDFLNSEELSFFYLPEKLQQDKKNSPDSLKFKVLNDSINKKLEWWTAKNIVSAWINEFSKLTEGKTESNTIVRSVKSAENEIANMILKEESKFDSLWLQGIILKKYLGEDNYLKFKSEADTATVKATELILVDFKNYSVRIVMPGALTGTNGLIDSNKVLLWPVKSDYFLTEKYEMWAESKVPNRWAWYISGLFLLFVLTGVIIRIKRKG
jgi:hypothetical protein